MAEHVYRVILPDDGEDRMVVGRALREAVVYTFGEGAVVESHDPWTGGQGAPDQWDRVDG